MAFYDNYVNLCNALGKTPSAVALEIGIAKSTVSRWRNAGTLPTYAVALKIAEYFGCSIDELLQEEPKTTFFKNFVNLCNTIGKTPSVVLEEMGYHRTVFTRWRNGTVPKKQALQKIAEYFRCSIEDLTTKPEQAVQPETLSCDSVLNRSFYENYVQLCAEKKVSLSAAAEAVGLSRTSPNGWKKGKQPSDVTLAKLAAYFGCTVDDLTAEAGQKEKPAHIEVNELEILDKIIDNMSREELLDFISKATDMLRNK